MAVVVIDRIGHCFIFRTSHILGLTILLKHVDCVFKSYNKLIDVRFKFFFQFLKHQLGSRVFRLFAVMTDSAFANP